MSVILATAGFDHKIRFWEAPSGICSRTIKFGDSQVNRLQITPDKQFIAAAGNPVIRLYEIYDAGNATTGGPHPNNSVNPTGTSATTNDPGQQAVLTLEGHTNNVTCIGFQKEGRYLYSASEDGTIKIWDLRNPNYSKSFDSGAPVNSVTLRSDKDEFISGDQNGYVKIWDLRGGSSGNRRHARKGDTDCLNSLRPEAGSVTTTKSSHSSHNNNNNSKALNNIKTPPSTTALTSSSSSVPLMSSTSHSSTTTSTVSSNYGMVSPIQAVDVSDDSRTLVAITNHGLVFVWDPTTPNPLLASPPTPTTTMEGQSEDQTTATTIDPSLVLSTSLLRPITKFRAHAPGYYCLHGKIAPDCRHLVTTGSDGLVKLWDTTTWECTATLVEPTNIDDPQQQQQSRPFWVWDAAFCADSSYLVTASSDHIARLWNLRTGDVVRKYHGHSSTVTCVALNDSSV